jgi:hypothetical protein
MSWRALLTAFAFSIVSLVGSGEASAQSPEDWKARINAVRNVLAARGVNFNHGPGECGRFEVTKVFAFLYRTEGVRLVAKFGSQNGCSADNTLSEPKYAVDAIILNGQTFDILTGVVDAQWIAVPGDPNLAREPFNPDQGTVTPPPPPPVTPPSDDAILRDIQARTQDSQHKLDDLQRQVDEARRELARLQNTATEIKDDTNAIRNNTNGLGDALKFIGKYIAPAIAALLAGRAMN